MADPITAIGLAASVVQIAGTGLKISKEIYVYTQSVKDVDKRLRDIAKHVEFTSNIISELGSLFGSEKTVALISENAVRTANGVVRECEGVFLNLDGLMKKGLRRKVFFPFREAKIDLLSANLERLKSSLCLLVQVVVHAQGIASEKTYADQVIRQHDHIRDLSKAKDDATQKYEDIRVQYEKLLETLVERDQIVDKPAASSKVSSASSLSAVSLLNLPKSKDIVANSDAAVVVDSSTFMKSESEMAATTKPAKRGISRSELDHCVTSLQELLKKIEQARDSLKGPNSLFLVYAGKAPLLEVYAKTKTDLDKSELADQPANLERTSAGAMLNDELARQRKQYENEIEQLRSDMNTAIQGKGSEFQEKIDQEMRKSKQQLELDQREQQELQRQMQQMLDQQRRRQETQLRSAQYQETEQKRELEEEMKRQLAKLEQQNRRMESDIEVSRLQLLKVKEKEEARVSSQKWSKKMAILQGNDNVTQLLLGWTTISPGAIKAALTM